MNLANLAANLAPDAKGLWRAVGTRPVSYPADGHATYALIEDTSFWFAHRNDCLRAVMGHFPPHEPLFDVGAGNGCVAASLQRAAFHVVPVEPGWDGARHCLARGLPQVLCSTLEDAGFAAQSLPSVGLFDVLEHQDDGDAFLHQIGGLLRPGGRLYITVPAYAWLWSAEDVAAGHFRRYTRRTLTQALRRAHFAIEYCSYFFALLPLPILLGRVLADKVRRHRSGLEDHHASPLVAAALARVHGAEVRAIEQGVALPFGSSILAVARAPMHAGQ